MYTKKIVDGYVEKTVTYDKRLEYCPYGSAGVVLTPMVSTWLVILLAYALLTMTVSCPVLVHTPQLLESTLERF